MISCSRCFSFSSSKTQKTKIGEFFHRVIWRFKNDLEFHLRRVATSIACWWNLSNINIAVAVKWKIKRKSSSAHLKFHVSSQVMSSQSWAWLWKVLNWLFLSKKQFSLPNEVHPGLNTFLFNIIFHYQGNFSEMHRFRRLRHIFKTISAAWIIYGYFLPPRCRCDLKSLYNEARKEKNGEKVNTGYGSTLSAAAGGGRETVNKQTWK